MSMSTARQFLYSWEEAADAGAGLAGGKGFNLGRLHMFGFNVPPGIVLNSQAYMDFIRCNSLEDSLENASREVLLQNLDDRSEYLGDLTRKIIAGSLPGPVVKALEETLAAAGLGDKPLAVRSSANLEDSDRYSFAGIHESFLNVKGLEHVIEAIKGCYASLWQPRAVAYRRRFGLPDADVLPAVVIMEMVPARASGVAFSCDPQTGRRDRLAIECTFGLGESLVSGAINPDSYYLDAAPFFSRPRVTEYRPGTRITASQPAGPVLEDSDIEKLGSLVLRVFESLGEAENHQDIEWAFDGQDFFLLQARPATALPRYTFEGLKHRTDIWSNGNYRDAVPMVLCPLHRRVMKHIIDIIQFVTFAGIDYPVPEGFQFSRFFNGRLYCDTSAYLWANYDCSGVPPQQITPFWGGHHPDLEIEASQAPTPERARLWQERAMKNQVRTMAMAGKAGPYIEQITSSVNSIMASEWEQCSDQELVALFDKIGHLLNEYSRQYIYLSGVNSLAFVGLMMQLFAYFGEATINVANGLLPGSQAVISSADHGYRLIELAEIAGQEPVARSFLCDGQFKPGAWETALPETSVFKQEFRRFLQDYGHRAVYELDIINPRWHEDPSYVLDIIRSSIDTASREQFKTMQKKQYEQTWQKVAARLPKDRLAEVESQIVRAQQGAALREEGKSVLARILELYRRLALETGRRLLQRGLLPEINDVFFCPWPDLLAILNGQWDGGALPELVAFRKASHHAKEALPAPDYIKGEEAVFGHVIKHPSKHWLQGLGASAGQAAGVIRLIDHPAKGRELQPGEVMVAPSTDPGWTPLFLKASAIIMETGGFLSHGAMVAREYGIPAVINVPGAMRHLANGQAVRVDGDMGRVYLT